MARDLSHKNHRQRVREEFRENGMDHFPPHKVLEMMLFYVYRQKDTNPLAHQLIDRFGSLSGVINAPYDLLLEAEGVGEEAATYIKALAAFVKQYLNDSYAKINTITTVEEAKDFMRYRFLDDALECVLLTCLGYNNRVIYSGILAKGTLEKVEILPKDVVKACLRADAAKAILAHNHPNGFCNPSRNDLSATFVLHEELKRVDVELWDHVIVASDGVFSLRESGMMPTR